MVLEMGCNLQILFLFPLPSGVISHLDEYRKSYFHPYGPFGYKDYNLSISIGKEKEWNWDVFVCLPSERNRFARLVFFKFKIFLVPFPAENKFSWLFINKYIRALFAKYFPLLYLVSILPFYHKKQCLFLHCFFAFHWKVILM